MKAKWLRVGLNQLTPGMIGKLNHYLDYLINKKMVRKPKSLKDWAGGLKDIKMTSIELQKLALDWRQK